VSVATSQLHRELDVLAERDREVAGVGGANVGLVLGAGVGVVGDHVGSGAQARSDERQDLVVERLVAVEQQEIDGVGEGSGAIQKRCNL